VAQLKKFRQKRKQQIPEVTFVKQSKLEADTHCKEQRDEEAGFRPLRTA